MEGFTCFFPTLSPAISLFIDVSATRWNWWNLWIKSSCYTYANQ